MTQTDVVWLTLRSVTSAGRSLFAASSSRRLPQLLAVGTFHRAGTQSMRQGEEDGGVAAVRMLYGTRCWLAWGRVPADDSCTPNFGCAALYVGYT